jgi:TP53 regulating kinase and related kinases
MSLAENKDEQSTKKLSDIELIRGFELIKQGAEAKIYTGTFEAKKVVAKERFKKTYRHSDLDKSLTSKRIKNEFKLLDKANKIGIDVPKVYKTDLSTGIIIMDHIENSLTCKDFIFKIVKSTTESSELDESLVKIATRIGCIIGKLHSNQIIHGDLTTSNILIKDYEGQESKIYFIDFGLSFISRQLEDKAVDLYVLERALQSTHSLQAIKLFEEILNGYKAEYGANVIQVIDRLEQVRLRGRKRTMIG